MAYIANFTESANTIQPQIHAVIMASRSVRSSDKFHQLLEIILAFGNYMNGAKRGPAYGFKIQVGTRNERASLLNIQYQSIHLVLIEIINESYFAEPGVFDGYKVTGSEAVPNALHC
jgi:hypothetical protein